MSNLPALMLKKWYRKVTVENRVLSGHGGKVGRITDKVLL